MPKQRLATWFDGIVALGTEVIPDAVSFSVIDDIVSVTHMQGDGAGEVDFPVGRKVHGEIIYNAQNAEFDALITGGSLTTGTIKRIRQGEESQTIAANDITLTQAALVKENTVRLYGGDGTVFQKVAAGPAVGEYSYVPATGVASFNAAETETTIYPDYLYTVSGSGQTLTLSVGDVPGVLELLGSIRTKNVNDGALGDLVVSLKKVHLGGPLETGGDSSGSTKQKSIAYTAVISAQGDYQKMYPV